MTTMPAFRIPDPEVHLEGQVRYRCATCLGLIDDPVAFVGPDGQPATDLTPDTRTYHPHHLIPQEAPDHGR